MSPNKIIYENTLHNSDRGGTRDFSGFQVTGMIFGFEIFDSGIFWGTKI